LRVLFLPSFYPSLGRPGLGLFFRKQAVALSRAGCDVHVLYWEPRSLRKLSIAGLRNTFSVKEEHVEGVLEFRRLGWNPGLASVGGVDLWSRFVRGLMRRYLARHGEPDVIHAHNAWAAGFAAHQIRMEYGFPYVLTEHSSTVLSARQLPVSHRRILEAAYGDAGKVIAVSQAMSDAIAPLAPAPPCVIPNCVFAEFFTLPPTPRQSGIFQFVCAANLIELKGIHILLRAFSAVFKGNMAVVLKIAGDGPRGTQLKNLARDLGIWDQVTWLGQLTHGRLLEELWSSHCFVLPSYRETFGVVLIEAMATGLPVVGTRCGGPEEIIGEGSGLLAPPGDVEGLSKALRAATLRRWDSDAIRRSAVSRYDAPVIANQLIAIYERVLRAPVSQGFAALQAH